MSEIQPPRAAARCAWCDRVIGHSTTEDDTHGICLECLPSVFGVPVQSVHGLDEGDVDRLPYGVVRLDEHERVTVFNKVEQDLARLEKERVLGRHFFREVAPCTDVKELSGWFREARERGRSDRTELDFVFRFPFGARYVSLALAYDAPTRTSTILVRDIQSVGETPAV